jgi:multidrug efflux pump subunit AcrA (membrane-fusion protein)
MPQPVFGRPSFRYGVIALALGLLIPVRMSTLAPVEIIPKEPVVVSASLDGVIAKVTIKPNETVTEGQLLLRFEDTVLRNDYEVAEKTLKVAEAEHLRAMQGAFLDEKTKADVALLKAKADLARAERDYAHEVLGRVEVKAVRSGVAIFHDRSDWDGKPVKTGERIMEIADPKQMALRVSLPVKEAIALETGAEVRAFFDADPLHPLSAEVRQASYQAELMPGDLLAYRVDADLEEDAMPENVRIGWQGTAKIYGGRAPLLYYLFHRPIASLRQYIGF